ncbi:MAG: bifunctional folylpolyglutamate synthase/dihydrofolate synthase [Aggregatilineales bacterium]
MNYDEALDYLYSLINYEVQRPQRYTPDVISLQRPRELLAALGNPHERYPAIHVTGTKGKGSVSAMCFSALRAAKLKVGFYSSPHLQDFRERFRLNESLIEPEALAALVERVKPLVERIPGLTWFEVVTAIAFAYFAEQQVDVAVIEVGLGGRLDATNLISKPLAAVITSLSYDHMHWLGNTLSEIAFEKAGIIKPGCPVVSAPQHAEAQAVIERTAIERNAPLTLIGRDWQVNPSGANVHGQEFKAGRTGEALRSYWTPLIGDHQAINAAVALAALEHVRAAGVPVDETAARAGLSEVNWPGRFEIVERVPWLILDVAHNAESAGWLAQTLATLFPDRKWIFVFGAFADKDVDGMFRALLPIAKRLIVMKAMNPRAFDTDVLADKARAAGFTGPIEPIPSAADALARAREVAGTDGLIAVTGSLSIVGEMRAILGLSPTRAVYVDDPSVQIHQSQHTQQSAQH